MDYFNIHDAIAREGIDYHTLTYLNRAVNLDSVEVRSGQVVTGCRFRVMSGALSIEVRGTDFDLTTGQLKNLAASKWYSSSDRRREEIVLDNLDIPLRSPEKSIPNILADRFVKFGPTSPYLDLAQTTIPFIDSQLVEPHNPVALSGIGLYYKSYPGIYSIQFVYSYLSITNKSNKFNYFYIFFVLFRLWWLYRSESTKL